MTIDLSFTRDQNEIERQRAALDSLESDDTLNGREVLDIDHVGEKTIVTRLSHSLLAPLEVLVIGRAEVRTERATMVKDGEAAAKTHEERVRFHHPTLELDREESTRRRAELARR